MSRPCRVCGAPMGKWVETCPSCGEYNKAKLPFYGWVIGGLLVLLLMLLLGDPGAIVTVVDKIIHQQPLAASPAN
jgi:hypothetical protein